jgi:hypothetical protein
MNPTSNEKEAVMGNSVGNKMRQKTTNSLPTIAERGFELAVLGLEDICHEIRDGQFTHGKEDTDRLYWQQKLKNIATPLSIALAEYKGPRVFHQHYIHDENGAEIPVMESARDNLIRSCEKALIQCNDMIGIKGSKLIEERGLLVKAVHNVLASA